MNVKKTTRAVGVCATALALSAFLPTTANAATLTASCMTTGANGSVRVPNFHGATERIQVGLTAYDSKADAKQARVRLLTKNASGKITYWSWHAAKGGKGTLKSWKTHAKDDRGIFNVGVQVARFDGSHLVNSCTDWS
ncbi:hypothetical protein [Streptomyces sp. CC224B]|uniref:hypothetical protein n=1 Tax=Streptomyces sp. CC224B TaxID=3044571 RepID=UPI0024A8C2F9|nr:hypothetical protein [Streptomyces sp. CC224B]